MHIIEESNEKEDNVVGGREGMSFFVATYFFHLRRPSSSEVDEENDIKGCTTAA